MDGLVIRLILQIKRLNNTKEYGQYLTYVCTHCHGENFNGQTLEMEDLVPNLTPGSEVAFWSEEEFIAILRTGVTPGGPAQRFHAVKVFRSDD